MKCYVVKNVVQGDEVFPPKYRLTKDEAQATAKAHPQHLWDEIVVQLLDVQDGQAGMLAALNGTPIIKAVVKQWGLGSRGGLMEEAVEKSEEA